MAKLISINPATGKELGSVKIATKAEVEAAVVTARKGFEVWREVPLEKRQKILIKVAKLVKKESKRLSKLVTQEMGKPLSEATDEVKGTVEEIEYLASLGAEILRDEVIEPKLNVSEYKQLEKNGTQDRLSYLSKKGHKRVGVVRYDPHGVVAMIKPWNFPVELSSLSVVSALIAGNSVIFKPSEYVPLVSQELAKLFWQAGVPREALQVIHGRGLVGAMLVDSEIDKVSFTGSTEVGREIAEKCATRFVRYTLEMGGSSPAIVCDDADLELAVNGVLFQRFFNCGQVCAAVKRVIVEKSVADKFTKMLIEAVEKLKMGDPMDKKNHIGPLVSLKQLRSLQDQVTKGVVQGGRILQGGRRMRDDKHKDGFYHEPTIMTYVRPSMDIMQEEVFGPVLPICMVDSFKQAIRVANNTKYGLTAMIFTKSKKKAQQFFSEVNAGGLTVNEVGAWNVKACFGGAKESGVGVELGKHGIWAYTQKRFVRLNTSNEKTRDWWFKVKDSNG